MSYTPPDQILEHSQYDDLEQAARVVVGVIVARLEDERWTEEHRKKLRKTNRELKEAVERVRRVLL
jgi:hypothetical protein